MQSAPSAASPRAVELYIFPFIAALTLATGLAALLTSVRRARMSHAYAPSFTEKHFRRVAFMATLAMLAVVTIHGIGIFSFFIMLAIALVLYDKDEWGFNEQHTNTRDIGVLRRHRTLGKIESKCDKLFDLFKAKDLKDLDKETQLDFMKLLNNGTRNEVINFVNRKIISRKEDLGLTDEDCEQIGRRAHTLVPRRLLIRLDEDLNERGFTLFSPCWRAQRFRGLIEDLQGFDSTDLSKWYVLRCRNTHHQQRHIHAHDHEPEGSRVRADELEGVDAPERSDPIAGPSSGFTSA